MNKRLLLLYSIIKELGFSVYEPEKNHSAIHILQYLGLNLEYSFSFDCLEITRCNKLKKDLATIMVWHRRYENQKIVLDKKNLDNIEIVKNLTVKAKDLGFKNDDDLYKFFSKLCYVLPKKEKYRNRILQELKIKYGTETITKGISILDEFKTFIKGGECTLK